MIKIQIALFILLFQIIPLKSQTRITTDFKDYRFEMFNLKQINKLDIRAQHAEVNLLNWDKDSVSVETTIEILSNKPNLSKEMLDEVQIKIVTYSNTLQVKTTLSKDFNRTIPYKINYNIFFPKKLAVYLENSHGIVNMAEALGGVIAKISYSDINIKSIKPLNDSINNKIDLVFCKGSIHHLGNANLTLQNSVIKTIDAGDLQAQSSYSTFSVEQLHSYTGNSNIDNLTLGPLKSISLKALSSLVTMESFSDSAFLNFNKGKLNLLNSDSTFSELVIDNIETETFIHLNNLTSYTINGEVTKGKFIHPQSENLQIIQEEFKTSFSGDVGSNPQSNSKVIIFNKNQNIEFK
ncbi:hypothetical protein E9993_20475 [Labilibacter sediminis]|nr:hypothetical protein E9993_20475 [Labilibacter sediminis]